MQVLYEQEGFQGNAIDYYSPDNSCIDQVLKRKRGAFPAVAPAVAVLLRASVVGLVALVGVGGNMLMHPGTLRVLDCLYSLLPSPYSAMAAAAAAVHCRRMLFYTDAT